MPKEIPKKAGSRWEGTHTYSRAGSGEKRPRTAAEVREEALRRIQEDRRKRNELADRRRSLPANKTATQHTPRDRQPENTAQEENKSPVTVTIEDEEDESKSMPGSNKKKRHASTAKPSEDAPDPADDGGVAPGLKAFLLSMKEDINRSTNEAVGKIDKRIDEHAQHIAELKQAVVSLDKRVDEKRREDMTKIEASIGEKVVATVRKEIARAAGGAGAAATAGPGPGTSRKQEAYNFCRRSLKMWPLEGDMQDAVKTFLSTRLQFSQETVDSLGMIEISMSRGRGAREKKEAIVTFISKEDRDYVKAAGVKLAGQSEAGMAIHVPGHLMDNLVALDRVGYDIKTKHDGVKRTVKFDDHQQDIYMDICVEGSWRKITPTKARKVARMSGLNGGGDLTLEDLEQLVRGEKHGDDPAAPPVVVPDDSDQ